MASSFDSPFDPRALSRLSGRAWRSRSTVPSANADLPRANDAADAMLMLLVLTSACLNGQEISKLGVSFWNRLQD